MAGAAWSALGVSESAYDARGFAVRDWRRYRPGARHQKIGDCFLREAKVGEAFAIRFADKMVCALHYALTFFEPFDFIDELFSSIRIIAKNDHVGFGGGRSPAKVFGLIVMFLRLGEMLIDAVNAMPFLRMVPDQNWLTERDHFESFSGGEMSPGCNVCVLFGELSKPRSFCCAF